MATSDLGNNSRVRALELLRLLESVVVRGYELSLVVRTSVADHNLRRVLVRHHHRGLRKSASKSIWVVWLQRLFQHPSVQVLPDLKLVLRKGTNLR